MTAQLSVRNRDHRRYSHYLALLLSTLQVQWHHYNSQRLECHGTTIPGLFFFFFYRCITHHNKTRKEVDFECCPFKTQWSVGYFIIRLNSTGQCFSCNDTVVKEYSKYQHYQRTHSSRSSQFTRMQRSEVLRNLKQNYFMRAGFLHKN